MDFTLHSMAAHLMRLEQAHHSGAVMHHALEKAALVVQEQVKEVIGTHHPGWAELTEKTQESRTRKGFTPDDPLLMSGKLRQSIGHTVHHHHAVIGSGEEEAVWQELGTSRIPPRSFLASSAAHKSAEVVHILTTAVVRSLSAKPKT